MSERIDVVSSAYWSSFVSSFSIMIPFIIEFCRIAIAKVSSATRNKYGQSESPCLTPRSNVK